MDHSQHFVEECPTCGAVVAQCRCMGPHKTRIVSKTLCAKCQATPGGEPPTRLTKEEAINLAALMLFIADDDDALATKALMQEIMKS